MTATGVVRRGVNVRRDDTSGLIPVDDFVGVSETPEGWNKRIDKVLEYSMKKWKMEATVKECAVVCGEDEEDPLNSNGSGEDRNYRS